MTTIDLIDPHLHLFNLTLGDYQWLSAENPPFWPDKNKIVQDFAEQDLRLIAPLALKGFVHIEAGFDNEKPWREIQWLEQCCQLPFRTIGCTDLTLSTAEFIQQITQLIQYPSLIGIRHILDENAYQLLTNEKVINNFKYLNSQGLNFEVQMPFTDTASVNALIELIEDNENCAFIINHGGFPPLTLHSIEWQRWQTNLTQVAQYQNVAIKCSGWEMNDRNYNNDWLKAVVKTCLSTFSTTRVMLASNFPLILFSRQYQDYWQSLVENLAPRYQQALFCDNARHWYQLP